MRIIFDACPLGAGQTGIGYYTKQLLTHMTKLSPTDEFFISDALFGSFATINRVQFPLDILPLIKAMQVRFPFMTLYRMLLYVRSIGSGMTGLQGGDIFFGTNFRGVFAEGMKTVLTVHDLSHEYFPEAVEDVNMNYFRSSFPDAVERADLLIADSENTKFDIIKFLQVPEEKIKVIYIGVDKYFQPVADPVQLAGVRHRYSLPEHFILMVGSIQPRKNIAGVLAAMASLLNKHRTFPWKLVLAGGGGWKNEGLADKISALGLEDRVHFTGYVADEDLPALYSLADLFVFPSLYEGFGLPVVEAMACGVPVVTSNNSCLPEIAGDAAVLVDPHDERDIANGMLRLLEDQDLRVQCVNRGLERARMFSWETAARQTLQAFHEIVDA
jgi:glycosyltransferase involved in cell wall biosynthesis